MSIRLRLTLLYSLILTTTLVVFGVALYTLQSRFTLNSLRSDLHRSGQMVGQSLLWRFQHPGIPGGPGGNPASDPGNPANNAGDPYPGSNPAGNPAGNPANNPANNAGKPYPGSNPAGDPAGNPANNPAAQAGNMQPPPPEPPGEQDFKDLREREVVRVLDAEGNMVATPPGVNDQPFAISAEGMQTLQAQQDWWQISTMNGERMLVYNRPIVINARVVYIVQAARSLAERDRSLQSLSLTLIIAGVITTLVAFVVGWLLSGTALRPIHRITHTAQAIENANDLTRRVNYDGPNDEIGQLATTFNSMLDRLQIAYQRVSYSLKMQRDFVADVSHELRTPLTTVRGNLALLRRTPPLPQEEQADILADMVEESDRLIRLVNDLLLLARADAGRGLVHETVPAGPVIAEACRQARALDRRREIREDGPQDMLAMGDRDALKQVLLILLDNALKHTDGNIQVSSEVLDGQVLITVADEGPGMPAHVQDHLFDRFYRGEADPAVPGFGLGLPIAKALVEGQGGRITVESQVTLGSRITVALPCAPPA